MIASPSYLSSFALEKKKKSQDYLYSGSQLNNKQTDLKKLRELCEVPINSI